MSGIKEIYNFIDSFAPFESQLEWDNSGFLIDSGKTEAEKVLVTLDVTPEVVREASKGGFDLIVSHHPVIFNPISALSAGEAAYLCAENGISVISAHTNFDLSDNGINFALAEKLGLSESVSCCDNILRLASIPSPLSADALAALVGEKLSASVRFNRMPSLVRTIAVCGGAGSDFFRDAKTAGADALVTGDAKYHEFLEAGESGICLVAAGHYETEIPGVHHLCHLLAEKFSGTQFSVSGERPPVMNI